MRACLREGFTAPESPIGIRLSTKRQSASRTRPYNFVCAVSTVRLPTVGARPQRTLATCMPDLKTILSGKPLLLLFISIASLFLPACQSLPTPSVRVDIEQAAHSLALQPPSQVQIPALSAQGAATPLDSARLEPLESPAPAETVRARRALALNSIEQQRAAVRERLLQARLQNLPELERRWEAEFRAGYDLDALRSEYDALWQEAFQQYGRNRFPLLVALIVTAPDSDARPHVQAQLDALDRAFVAQEQDLRAQYQARLERIEQEVRIRVSARRREFTRNAEAEVREQLAQQPDAAELYLPQPQVLPPAPARKEPIPATSVKIAGRDPNLPLAAHRAETEALRRQILQQLAQEWAQARGYQLTNDPNAPDKTQEFVDYLLAR